MNKLFPTLSLAALVAISMNAASVSYVPQIRMSAAEVNNEIIFDKPDGTLSWLDRTCDGFVTEAFATTHGEILGSIVQMVEGDDGFVYLNHMASEYPVDTWTRFERDGNTLVMEGVQAIYMEYDDYYDEEFIVYLAPMKLEVDENNRGTFVVTDDCRFVLNVGEDGSLTSADPQMLLGVCVHTLDEDLEGNDVWIWKGFGDRDIKMAPADGKLVTLPEGLDVRNWVMFDGYMKNFVQVAIDGEDFYVNGVDRSLPDAWVKGKIADGKVIFPSGQYLGADMEIYYYSYFCGAEFFDEEDEEGEKYRACSYADSAIFAYDAEAEKLTMERGYIINSTPEKLFPLYFYEDVSIEVQHRNPEAAPEAPYDLEFFESNWGNSVWFQLPNIDVDGNILLVSNLYYEIYVNGELQSFDIFDEAGNAEKTSLIPYLYDDWDSFWVASEDPKDHTVYLYNDGDVIYIGIRSVYINENGEEVYSEMAYWGEPDSKEEVLGERVPVLVKWFDLQGRPMQEKGNGVSIRVATYSDGTVESRKVR